MSRQAARSLAANASQVVVKFDDNTSFPSFAPDDLLDELEAFYGDAWRQLVTAFPGITVRPMFTSISADRVGELVATAKRYEPRYLHPNFLSYFIFESPGEPGSGLLERLDALKTDRPGSIIRFYVDPPGIDAMGTEAANPLYSLQEYLKPAPQGIDAHYAWLFPGGDGAGQALIDMEKGWTLEHQDLAGKNIDFVYGTLQNDVRRHGTAVLGEICAVNNTLGVVGIAHNLPKVGVVSYYDDSRPNAIMAALADLPYGGILLLEAQLPSISNGTDTFDFVPIELQHADFDVIRLAASLGITVVEAAGNGSHNLDDVTDETGAFVLNRDNENDFRDSGAIMVGAATASAPHTRLTSSNYGNRVDCYAWGEDVVTTDSSTAADLDSYRYNFSGTSSASAIVAGAAVAVQGIAENNLKFKLGAWQMRKLVSSKAGGTPSKDPAADRIGVMPDLRKLIKNKLISLAPDVYLRDFVGDDGDPHTGSISSSPDIILRPTPVADPQGAFGEGSGTENDATLGHEATAGQDNYVYVRARNRGAAAAANATVEVYWSPVTTIPTPDLWKSVGSATLQSIPGADVLTVFPTITWPATEVPPSGHYCFVGVVGSDADPAPMIGGELDWDLFRRLIRDNNNVTWRNFNVVDITATQDDGGLPGFAAMGFMAAGAPDRALRMDLEVFARLPADAELRLEVPVEMYERLSHRFPVVSEKEDEANPAVQLPMNPHGSRVLADIDFPKAAKFRLRLLVRIPERHRHNAYELHVRQLHAEDEVGRATWRLVAAGARE